MTNHEIAFTCQQIDGAYVNSLVDLINACRKYGAIIDKVNVYQHGWLVTFAVTAVLVMADYITRKENVMIGAIGVDGKLLVSRGTMEM